MDCRSRRVSLALARADWTQAAMDGGGSGGAAPLNNKPRAMIPNKSRGEFTRNARKDSEVRDVLTIPVYSQQRSKARLLPLLELIMLAVSKQS